MKQGKVLSVVFAALVFAAGSVRATVIRVPDDYPRVQFAINAASSGDTVLVAGGRYAPSTNGEVFYIRMKNGVRLIGAGAAACTLDAERRNSVIYCSNISNTATRIEGFTITNGSYSYGGGISCWNYSSLTITNNVITGNSASYYGGGIWSYYYSTPTITNNVITGNSAGYWGGGIMSYYYSNPTVTNNVITGNSANDFGGGIGCYYNSSPTITNNTITGNSANNYGGGIDCYYNCSPTITNNIITENSARYGGGIRSYNSSPTITYDDVWNNTALSGPNYYGCSAGTGCIDADPLFMNLGVGDYHLQSGSPCIDTGDNNAPGLPSFDFDGNARIVDGDGDGIAVVDMGPFEFLVSPRRVDIVEEELSVSYAPPNPWVQQEFVELEFAVTAIGADLTHIRFFSDPLQHESLPKKIPDDLVEFIPEEIGFLAEDDTAVVMVRLEIPIGQHEGNYSGYFRAICYEGFSDSVALTVTVEPLADIDFDREKVALAAHPDGSDSDLCIVVNPNSWDNNPDPVDGPGNVNLGSIRYSFTNLTGAGGTIPSSAVSVSSNQSSLGSGESDEIILTVDIPSGQLAGEYEGKAFVSGMMVAKMRHGPDMIPRPQDAVDSLTLEVTVLPQKVLNIVQNSITATVTPSNPWVEPLSAGFAFDVENTGNDTLKNVSLFSTNLSLDSRDPIYAYTVAFDPPVLGWIEAGGVRQIQATVPVPIGQYNGTYSGSFSAVSGNLLGAEDEVAASLTVEPVSDLDIEDYSGNLEGNTMILTGVKEGIALGTFTIVNPNSWDNNADLFDGPANCNLDDLEWESTDLRICGKGAKCKGVTMVEFKNLGPGADIMVICKGVIYFQGYVLHDSTFVSSNDPDKLGTNTEIWVNGSVAEKVHTSCSKPIYVGMVWGDFELVDLTKIYSKKESIPAANVEVAFTGNGDLDSGEGVKGLVEINIPKGVKHWKHDYDHAYCGTITISGSAFGTTVSDNFRVLLRVIKGDTGWAMSGFWGENEGAAIVLHWSGLSDLEANGYAVYRNDVKIVDLPASVYGYTDHVSTRATYDYRLGVQVGGSKIMIGPITIGCILPTVFSLSQNEPNPVRNHTSIRYTVAEAGNVTIEVYNSVGMLVRTVVNEYKTPGVYTVNWEKIDLANGVYFYNMSAGGFSVSRKMVVVK